MTWTRAAVIGALALLVSVPPAAAKVPRNFVGIESQETFQNAFNNDIDGAASDLSAQAAVGIRIHRQLFNWELIERERGVYDFSFVDRYMTEMAEARDARPARAVRCASMARG